MEWHQILTREEIAAYHALTASLDPRFARADAEFYASRTKLQLQTLAAQAWNGNIRHAYVLARSYAALAEDACTAAKGLDL